MKNPIYPFLFVAVLFGLAFSSVSAQPITIDTVVVGNAGNAGEVQFEGTFGGVSYDYHIGTYLVTNAQYTVFLNAVATLVRPSSTLGLGFRVSILAPIPEPSTYAFILGVLGLVILLLRSDGFAFSSCKSC